MKTSPFLFGVALLVSSASGAFAQSCADALPAFQAVMQSDKPAELAAYLEKHAPCFAKPVEAKLKALGGAPAEAVAPKADTPTGDAVVNAEPEPPQVDLSAHGDYVHLTTMFRGPEGECLASSVDGRILEKGTAHMALCENTAEQLWAWVDAGDGYFHLTTKAGEATGLCLDGNEANGRINEGATYLATCQNVPSQLWLRRDEGGGFFRLTTQERETSDACLEGNQINGSVKRGAAFLDDCQNVSGQFLKELAVQ